MGRPFWSLLVVTILALGFGVPGASGPRPVILATTTSTQDSGLLEVLLPLFQRRTGIPVRTIAVGSGQALAMGRKGEADVLLSHSPDAERQFMADGYGLDRRRVMHNDFVIVGPAGDPAGVRGARCAAEALGRIAARGALWVSRSDNSGTHAEEQKLWRAARISPGARPWYLQTGLGMGPTLQVAAEKKGYTLSDRGTFLAMDKVLGLAVLCAGDAGLLNQYHVIQVDPIRFPKVNGPGAAAFAEFLLSPEAQEAIRSFGIASYGQPLFFPDAGQAGD